MDTAGADVVGRVVQRRDSPDPATFIGRGKAEELRRAGREVDADTVVFDDELSPAQQRNLEKMLGRTAIDRTAVILDIFAQNARSPEGKAQVELALLRYRLPRLRGRGRPSASRPVASAPAGRARPSSRWTGGDWCGGCTGSRPTCASSTAPAARSAAAGPAAASGVALVGYTNAGKSTLLNRLTDADVPVENRLFATLDPRTRQLALPGGETVLVTDTVGFVRKLPHQLVEAFRSTLEVVRAGRPPRPRGRRLGGRPEGQMAAVRTVLAEIGAGDVPELLVVNKADRAPSAAKALAAWHPGRWCSRPAPARASTSSCGRRRPLRGSDRVVELVVPWARGDVLAAVHREGEVVGQSRRRRVGHRAGRPGRGGRARFAEFVAP